LSFFKKFSGEHLQTISLTDKTKFGPMELFEMKKQNKYGTMYGLSHKVDLVTTEYVGEYYTFRSSETNKVLLAVDAACQIGVALGKIQTSVTKEKGFNFKPSKDKIYIKLTEQQAQEIPKFHNLMVSVQVYGVFSQNSSGLAFIQCELSGFKADPQRSFDASDDNAVLP